MCCIVQFVRVFAVFRNSTLTLSVNSASNTVTQTDETKNRTTTNPEYGCCSSVFVGVCCGIFFICCGCFFSIADIFQDESLGSVAVHRHAEVKHVTYAYVCFLFCLHVIDVCVCRWLSVCVCVIFMLYLVILLNCHSLGGKLKIKLKAQLNMPHRDRKSQFLVKFL